MDYVIKFINASWPIATLFKLRLVNKKWKQLINEYIGEFISLQKIMKNKLDYDHNLYDSTYYKREIIKKTLNKQINEYKNIKIPIIEWFPDDLSEEDWVCMDGLFSLPIEFKIFFYEYIKSPSIFIKLYPASTITEICQLQYEHLKKLIYVDISNLLYLIPLCYSKHYRETPEDDQYVNILCYVNVIDPELDEIFPEENERYIVISLDIHDLENNERHYEIIKKFLELITQKCLQGEEPEELEDLEEEPECQEEPDLLEDLEEEPEPQEETECQEETEELKEELEREKELEIEKKEENLENEINDLDSIQKNLTTFEECYNMLLIRQHYNI